VIWLYKDTTLNIRRGNFNITRGAIGFVNTVLILVVTLLMLNMGANIPWINYYIVTQSGQAPLNIMNIIFLPTLYIKVISLVFSSLLAFSLSVYLDIRKSILDTEVYEKRHASLSTIIYAREEFIKKTDTRINIKVLIFLVLFGIAIIPYSDEGFATILPAGMLFVLPCALAFMIFLFIGFFQKSEGMSQPFLLESIKKCQKCGYVNADSAVFCVNCKNEITSKQALFPKTVECTNCKSINPAESKYCKDCGVDIEKKSDKEKKVSSPAPKST